MNTTVIKPVLLILFTGIILFWAKNYPSFEIPLAIVYIFLLPLLNYFLFRNTYFVLVVALICLKIGGKYFPLHTDFTNFVFTNKYIRLFIVFYAIFKVFRLFYSFVHKFSTEVKTSAKPRDYYLILQKLFKEIYANNLRYAGLVAQEVAVLTYGVFLWKKSDFDNNYFSYTQTNANKIIYWMLLLVAIIETICVHLLLFHFKLYVFSFILLFLNIYTAMALIAHLKAMDMRPIFLKDKVLHIKNGLFANVIIDLNDIDSIELHEKEVAFVPKDKKVKMSLLKKIEGHNIKISLKKEVQVDLFYGFKKSANEIYFFVDEKTKFLQEVLSNKTMF